MRIFDPLNDWTEHLEEESTYVPEEGTLIYPQVRDHVLLWAIEADSIGAAGEPDVKRIHHTIRKLFRVGNGDHVMAMAAFLSWWVGDNATAEEYAAYAETRLAVYVETAVRAGMRPPYMMR